jgi:hypothetical protein
MNATALHLRRLKGKTLGHKRNRRQLGLLNWWRWMQAGRKAGLPCRNLNNVSPY